MPPRLTRHQVLPRQLRSLYRAASHRKNAGHAARKGHASDNGLLTPPDRHGPNDRSTALNRKNALFAGSDGGGQHWAVLATLVETCKLNDVEPQAYLADVLTRLVNGHPNSRIDDLLPWAYVA